MIRPLYSFKSVDIAYLISNGTGGTTAPTIATAYGYNFYTGASQPEVRIGNSDLSFGNPSPFNFKGSDGKDMSSHYSAYFEDFDLGLRAWKMGWKLYYEHESICFHKVSATTNKLNKSNYVKIIYYRNNFILHARQLKGFRKIAWYSQLFTSTLFWHIIKGEFWIFYSLFEFLKHKNKINNSKSQIIKMQQELNINSSIDDILTIFKNSLKNKSIKWI